MVPNKPLDLKVAIHSPKPLEFLQMVERRGLRHLQMTHTYFLKIWLVSGTIKIISLGI